MIKHTSRAFEVGAEPKTSAASTQRGRLWRMKRVAGSVSKEECRAAAKAGGHYEQRVDSVRPVKIAFS